MGVKLLVDHRRGVVALVFALASLAALGMPTAAVKAYGSDVVPNIAIAVNAESAIGHGRIVVPANEAVWDPNTATLSWLLNDPIDIYDENNSDLVGTLLSAQVVAHLDNNFSVQVNIGVLSYGNTTTFEIASPLVPTGAGTEDFTVARCYASLTLTDLGGDGAAMIGEGGQGNGAFRAFFDGYLEDGTRFAHMLSALTTDHGGTVTGSEVYPQFGFLPTDSVAEDLSTQLAFTITPNDLFYATTEFEVSQLDPCYGDVNSDWRLDIGDLAVLLGAYGTSAGDAGFNPAADLNQDGTIDVGDVSELLSVYGDPCY